MTPPENQDYTQSKATDSFTKVYADWRNWARDKLSDAEFRMAIEIMSWTQQNPSISILARQTNMSLSKAKRAILALERKNAIEIIRRGRGARNHYVIKELRISGVTSDLPAHLSRSVTSDLPAQNGSKSVASPKSGVTSGPIKHAKTQEEDEEKKLLKRVSLTEESSCERRAREGEKTGEKPDDSSPPTFGSVPLSSSPEKTGGKEKSDSPLSSPPTFGSVPPRDSKQPGENSRGLEPTPLPPPLSTEEPEDDISRGVRTMKENQVNQGAEKMSRAHIRAILMIVDGRIDPAAPEDPDFLAVLDSIDDDEWSEELRVLDPWRKGGVCDE